MYIYRSRQLQLTGRQGEHRCLFTHTHTEERDGDSAGSTRAFRGAESASRNLRRKRLWRNNRGEELGPSPAALRPLQCAIPFPSRLPLFYSSRREAVIIRYITLILCPFGQRYTSILSLLNACYLGFHLSRLVPTYLLYNEKCARV